RAATVRARGSASLEKRGADDVLGVDDVRRSEQPGRESEKRAVVPVEQSAQGRAVVDRAGGDQRLVGQLAGRAGQPPEEQERSVAGIAEQAHGAPYRSATSARREDRGSAG